MAVPENFEFDFESQLGGSTLPGGIDVGSAPTTLQDQQFDAPISPINERGNVNTGINAGAFSLGTDPKRSASNIVDPDLGEKVKDASVENLPVAPQPIVETGLDDQTVKESSSIFEPVTPKDQDRDSSTDKITSTIIPPPKPIEEAPVEKPKEEPPKEDSKDKTIATVTPTELDKTIDSLVDDIDTSGLEFIKSMMEGDDPLAEKAFNFEVSKLGPIWEAQNASLSLKLKQLGIEGSNAGTAWLQNMAQRQGVEVSQITSRLNFESAQRIQDWNRYGPERANQIVDNRLNRNLNQYNFGMQQVRDQIDLGNTDPQSYVNIAAANGVTMSPETAAFVADNVASNNENDRLAALRELNSNYLEIENSLENMVPGLSVDGSALNSLTPEQQNDVRNRVKEINKAIKTNDVAKAQELMGQLKELYPNSIAGDYSAWNPADFRTWADQQAMNTWTVEAKTQFDNGNVDEAMKILTDNVLDPLLTDENFASLWSTSAPERKSEVMELAGLDGEPISADDKMAYLAADKLVGMQKTTVDEIFKSYFDNAPAATKEWLLDPDNAETTKAWIFDVVSGPYEIDDNGLIVPLAGQQLAPWNPDSNNSHYFTDWAMADSFNEEDGTVNITYDGGNVYEDDNEFQTSDGYANYRKQMDDAWQTYKKGGGELDRQRWFEDVSPVWDGETVVFNGEAEASFVGDDDNLDPITRFTNQSVEAFDEAVESGNLNTLSDDQLFAALSGDPEALTRLTTSNSLPNETSQTLPFVDIGGTNWKIANSKTWAESGLSADVVNIEGDNSIKGSGDGEGTIIIWEGRPLRITSFSSSKSSGGIGGSGKDTRRGVLKGEFLDEDPKLRDEVDLFDTGNIIASDLP
jgi:hypothetical protein